MKYSTKHKTSLGASGDIISMMQAVLSDNQADPEASTKYCIYGIDYLERECDVCNLVNYDRDCHNNPISSGN